MQHYLRVPGHGLSVLKAPNWPPLGRLGMLRKWDENHGTRKCQVRTLMAPKIDLK